MAVVNNGESHAPVPEYLRQNIQSVAQIEQQFAEKRSIVDRISDNVSSFAGSVYFVIVHIVVFGFWLILNVTLPFWQRFDPNLSFLALWASLEGILLTAFLLISQNRQRRILDHWAHVSLQVSLLAEQEMTKMLEVQQRICDRMGMTRVAADPQLQQMIEPTNVESLMEVIAKTREGEPVVEISSDDPSKPTEPATT